MRSSQETTSSSFRLFTEAKVWPYEPTISVVTRDSGQARASLNSPPPANCAPRLSQVRCRLS